MVSEQVAAKRAVITQDDVDKGRTPYSSPSPADLRKRRKRSDKRDSYHSYAIVPTPKPKKILHGAESEEDETESPTSEEEVERTSVVVFFSSTNNEVPLSSDEESGGGEESVWFQVTSRSDYFFLPTIRYFWLLL